MAVTQYIGARYVPLFADPLEWDSAKAYEPLTIVYYQGNSYTSKQAVPSGLSNPSEATEYWALTGNYNAQIEQYRTEVQAYDERITQNAEDIATNADAIATNTDAISDEVQDRQDADDALASDIQDEVTARTEADEKLDNKGLIKVKALYGANSLTLVQTEGKNIVIDFSSESDNERIRTFLNSNGVSHIDYAICTHFHFDHFTGINAILEFCDSTTKFYRQMPCTNTNAIDYAAYLEESQQMATKVASIGAELITPFNGQTENFGEHSKIEFWNANTSFEASYKNSWRESEDVLTAASQSMNNYSLIVRVENAGSSYVDCGDVETQAQINNAPSMKKASLVKYPHHNINRMGYYDFFNRLACDTYFYNYHQNRMEEMTLGGAGFQLGYLYRYTTQIRYADIYINHKTECSFVITDGSVQVDSGYYVNPNSGNKDFTIERTVRGAMPPAKQYYDNPNQLYNMTLAQMCTAMNEVSTFNNFLIDSASSWAADSEFMKDCRALFELSASDSFSAYVQMCARNTLELTISNSYARKKRAIVYTTFNRDNMPDTGARLLSDQISRSKKEYVFDTPLTPNNTTTLTSLGVSANLFYNDIIGVVTEENVMIPCVRVTDNWFAGSSPSWTGAETIHVALINKKLQQCYGINTSTGEKTVRRVKRILNPVLTNSETY